MSKLSHKAIIILTENLPPYPSIVSSIRSLTYELIAQKYPAIIKKHEALQVLRDKCLNAARSNDVILSEKLFIELDALTKTNLADLFVSKLWQAMNLPVLAYIHYRKKKWEDSTKELLSAIEADKALMDESKECFFLELHILHLKTNIARVHYESGNIDASYQIYIEVLQVVSNQKLKILPPVQDILIRQIADDLSSWKDEEISKFTWEFLCEKPAIRCMKEFLQKKYSAQLLEEDPKIFGKLWVKNAKKFLEMENAN